MHLYKYVRMNSFSILQTCILIYLNSYTHTHIYIYIDRHIDIDIDRQTDS